MNALTTVNTVAPVANALAPRDFGQAMQLAEMMAGARLVPSHLQGKPADCLLIIEQANRWNMSPFAVAQATSVIQGKLMFEGKLVAAAINTSGILSKRLDFEFSGSGNDLEVVVTGQIRGEDKVRSIRLKLKDAKTSNGIWNKQPEQQLTYAGTRVWARRHTPEIMLGVYSEEEFEDQTRSGPEAAYAEFTEVGNAAPATETRRGPPPPPADEAIDAGEADAFDEADYLDGLKKLFAAAKTAEEVEAIAANERSTVSKLQRDGKLAAMEAKKARIAELAAGPSEGETRIARNFAREVAAEVSAESAPAEPVTKEIDGVTVNEDGEIVDEPPPTGAAAVFAELTATLAAATNQGDVNQAWITVDAPNRLRDNADQKKAVEIYKAALKRIRDAAAA